MNILSKMASIGAALIVVLGSAMAYAPQTKMMKAPSTTGAGMKKKAPASKAGARVKMAKAAKSGAKVKMAKQVTHAPVGAKVKSRPKAK